MACAEAAFAGPSRVTGEGAVSEPEPTPSARPVPRAPAPAPCPERPPAAVPHPSHLLVCLDRSRLGECGLPHAVALARAWGARLTLLHVLETPREGPLAAPADPLAWEIASSEAREYLRGLLTRGGLPELVVETVVLPGHAAEQIKAYVRTHGVDVIVLSSHGQGGLSEWCLAGTALKVVEGVPGSLLLVPASHGDGVVPRYGRILVPLDGSPRAECVLPLARSVAEVHGAELLLVHVVPPCPPMPVGPLGAEDLELERKLVRRNADAGAAYLGRLQERLRPDRVRVRTLLAEPGDPRTVLVDLIESEQADLVVLAAHGSTGACDAPYGSTTAHLIARATRPLLVVQDLPVELLLRRRRPRAASARPDRPRDRSRRGFR